MGRGGHGTKGPTAEQVAQEAVLNGNLSTTNSILPNSREKGLAGPEQNLMQIAQAIKALKHQNVKNEVQLKGVPLTG